MADKLEFR
jgi:hypothetical protein